MTGTCQYCQGHQTVITDGEYIWGTEWRGFKVVALCRHCVRWLHHGGA